jgi:hypothetical protein
MKRNGLLGYDAAPCAKSVPGNASSSAAIVRLSFLMTFPSFNRIHADAVTYRGK